MTFFDSQWLKIITILHVGWTIDKYANIEQLCDSFGSVSILISHFTKHLMKGRWIQPWTPFNWYFDKIADLPSWPNFSFKILSTTSTYKFLPNFSFKVLTKINLQNFNQTLPSEFWPNFSFKILTKWPDKINHSDIYARITWNWFVKSFK